jgi:hypothetical protein
MTNGAETGRTDAKGSEAVLAEIGIPLVIHFRPITSVHLSMFSQRDRIEREAWFMYITAMQHGHHLRGTIDVEL